MARVVIVSERELYPRCSRLIANPAREDAGAEEFLARYRVRGSAENTFGERKSTLRAAVAPIRGRSASKPARRSRGPSRPRKRTCGRRTKPFCLSTCSGVKPCS